MRPPARAAAPTVIFKSTIGDTTPVFHFVDPTGLTHTFCGRAWNEHHVPRRLPFRHAARFARLCLRCSVSAAMLPLITADPPELET